LIFTNDRPNMICKHDMHKLIGNIW
jgi:hypothetical protein